MVTVEIVTLPEQFAAAQEIRHIVFQVEQGVEPELDFDPHDETSTHIIACLDNQPVGTARIRYLDNQTAKIERLAVLPIGRGRGIGRKIMEKALAVVKTDTKRVLIHAQAHLKEFYQQLGFQPEGETFQEAGIPHVKMKKTLG